MSLSLSTVLRLVAGALPRRRGSDVVVALIRGYQRLLSRFTPSCRRARVDAVRTLGPPRGIRAAAARIRACGMPG
jgi:putative component of membrane protein insertase Oxa1/YidC/SpoIIIJ protein YidD